MMKKLFQIIFCCVLISILSVHSVWALPNTALPNITVTFSDNSCFSDSEKNLIINSFTQTNEYEIQPFGLYCFLFGHDYISETITVIRHKVYSSDPRCIKDYYRSQICSRCSDVQNTLINSVIISCCL